jgi:hypothetical protein
MFEMTRPGGVMLIPNFLTSVRDRGYMEAFMDWRLIYRDHADMQALAAVLPPSEVADCQIFDDGDDAITFLLVTKARLCGFKGLRRKMKRPRTEGSVSANRRLQPLGHLTATEPEYIRHVQLARRVAIEACSCPPARSSNRVRQPPCRTTP